MLKKDYIRDGTRKIIGSVTTGDSDTSAVVRDEGNRIAGRTSDRFHTTRDSHGNRISALAQAAPPPRRETMCEIGKPIEIIDVEPVSLPAPLRGEKKQQPTEQPVAVEFPVFSETTGEPVIVEKL